jgi:hypothetical protein
MSSTKTAGNLTAPTQFLEVPSNGSIRTVPAPTLAP